MFNVQFNFLVTVDCNQKYIHEQIDTAKNYCSFIFIMTNSLFNDNLMIMVLINQSKLVK